MLANWHGRHVHIAVKLCTPGFAIYAVCIISSRPIDAYMHQETRAALVQKIACGLLDTKLLSEPVLLVYWQSDRQKHISIDFIWNSKVVIVKNAFKYVICNWWPVCVGFNVLISTIYGWRIVVSFCGYGVHQGYSCCTWAIVGYYHATNPVSVKWNLYITTT